MPFPIQRRLARFALLALLLPAAPVAAAEDPLPADLAAMHADGKWKMRKADLYRYLVKYESGQSNALAVLPEFMKLRLVEDEARRRKISVSEEDVDRWFQSLQDRMAREGQFLALERSHGADDDRNARGLLIALEQAAHLVAVHARHHEVEQDQVRAQIVREAQPVLSVGRHVDLVAGAGEHELHARSDATPYLAAAACPVTAPAE